MDLSSINLVAVLIAAVLSFMLGALWYSDLLFGKMWRQDVEMTDEKMAAGNPALIMGVSFVMILIMAFALAALFTQLAGPIDLMFGITRGFAVGMGFVATSMAVNIMYQGKPLRLLAIDAGYQVLFLTLMGAVLALIP